ncbi:MAG TPA: primosomal protein N' [Thermoanaerobaculia bacterium]|nr:primosomal protein N' [Thermoanaerobaculia bacterium]
MPARVSVAFPLPLRRAFTYAVPAAHREGRLLGCRVTAPLGGRTLSGVVVEEDPRDPEAHALRELSAVLDEEPAVEGELLETTRALADRFFCSWGELLRAALPAGLPRGEATRYEATAKGAASLAGADPEGRAILEMLLERGRADGALLAALGPGSRERLRELEGRGWVRTLATPVRRARRQAVYSLAGDAAGRSALAGRSAKGREALRHMEVLGRPALAEELRAAGFSAALMRRLAARGAVSAGEQERAVEDDSPIPPRPEATITLSPDQEAALSEIHGALDARRFAPMLLFGVTGSGKTEVYLRAIARARASGRGAIWLVPEIALTPVFARRLGARFGDDAVVLHSAIGESRRARAWQEMRLGRARIVIGPRSAVFAPIADIGVVVVDEEHDGSYKQQDPPRYDARDAAALRAQAHGAVLLLGSATPAMETWQASEEGKIRRLAMPERIERRPLPEVRIVDLRRETALPEEKGVPLFSRALVDLLEGVFARREQAILLAPRRGYAPFLLCRACGHAFPCSRCSVSSVVHRRDGALRCHYCGSRRPIPSRCDACGGRHLEAIGAGTERAAERFAALFPSVPFAVLDSDTARRRGGAAAVVASMENGEVRALIGTQMVAKGHHFPEVTAIGVLSADTILNFPDFRAAEKTFQLLAQVAGRSGRGERPGTVLVQTFHPENGAIRAALAHDVAAFARGELEFRRTFFYPPFCEMAEVLVSAAERGRAAEVAAEIASALGGDEAVRVTAAAPAPLERIAGKWRYQVLVRSRSRRAVLAALARAVPESPPPGASVAVDVDPRNLM